MRIGGVTLMAVGVGGLIFWFGYYRNADAQSPIINNAPSINTFNQSGGNNTISVAPTRLPFDPAIGDQLASKLPSGKPIELMGVGSQSDWAVAGQYAQFLKSKGFDVTLSLIGMMVPPPDHRISIGDPNAARITVIIAPSVN